MSGFLKAALTSSVISVRDPPIRSISVYPSLPSKMVLVFMFSIFMTEAMRPRLSRKLAMVEWVVIEEDWPENSLLI